jgi:potassium efflux system protein
MIVNLRFGRAPLGILVLSLICGAIDSWAVTPAVENPPQEMSVSPTDATGSAVGSALAQQATIEGAPEPTVVTTFDFATEIAALEAKTERTAEEEARLNFLKEGLAALNRAKDYRKQAIAFREQRLNAPKLLEAIQKELAAPVPEQVTVDAPKDASIEQLEQYLRVAQAESESMKKAAEDLETEAGLREKRLAALPEELVQAKAQLEEAKTKAAQLPEQIATWTGQQLLQAAQQEELRWRVFFLQEELASYDGRRELLKARRQQAQLRAKMADLKRTAWEKVLQTARQREILQQQQQASRAAQQSADADPQVVQAIERNKELTEERADLQAQRQTYEKRLQDMRERAQSVAESYKQAKIRVDAVGFNDVVGQYLRSELVSLPSLRMLRRQQRLLQTDTYDIQVRMIELRDELAKTEKALADAGAGISENLAKQLTNQIGFLESLIRDNEVFLKDVLLPYELELENFITDVSEYREYILERILWTRSIPPISRDDLFGFPQAIMELGDLASWQLVWSVLLKDSQDHPLSVASSLIVILMLWILRPLFLRRLRTIHKKVRRASTDRFSLTVRALLLTIPLSISAPSILLFLGWRLSLSIGPEAFPVAVGNGFLHAGAIIAVFNFARELFRPEGLAQDHFRWRTVDCQQMRKWIRIANWILVPEFFLVVWVSSSGMDETLMSTVGRLVLILGTLAMGFVLWRVIHPVHGAFRTAYVRYADHWFIKWRKFWFALLFIGILWLAVLPAIGFFYTDLKLQIQLFEMSCWLIGIVVVRGLVKRWLLIAQRSLAIHRSESQTDQPEEPQHIGGVSGLAALADFPSMDLSMISVQSKKLVHTLTIVALLVGVWATWDDVLPALRILEQKKVWSYWKEEVQQVPAADETSEPTVVKVPVEVPVTLADLGMALIVALGTIAASRNIPGLLEITVLRRLPMDSGGRYAISTLSRYAIVILGIIFFFNILGIGWSDIQWLAAAITFGLGFGLQEIFANFVSGLIILFERPMRVGDVVTISGISGSVTRIQMRATTITDWDRKELIVPNREFITGQLVNWTLSDTTLRLVVPVGIAYGSDIDKAEELLLQIAREDPDIMDDPAPSVWFHGFGDNSLTFELRGFIPKLTLMVDVSHRIYRKVNNVFNENGIEIAFPQRDLHLRSIKGPIPVAIYKDKEIELPADG